MLTFKTTATVKHPETGALIGKYSTEYIITIKQFGPLSICHTDDSGQKVSGQLEYNVLGNETHLRMLFEQNPGLKEKVFGNE